MSKFVLKNFLVDKWGFYYYCRHCKRFVYEYENVFCRTIHTDRKLYTHGLCGMTGMMEQIPDEIVEYIKNETKNS